MDDIKCQFYDDCSYAGTYEDCDYDHWVIFPCPHIIIEEEGHD